MGFDFEAIGKYLRSLKVGEKVIETAGHRKGMRGEVYISSNPMTAGSICVMWDDKMGTSVTATTKRLSESHLPPGVGLDRTSRKVAR